MSRVKAQLRNWLTGKRERTIELDGLRNADALFFIPSVKIQDDPRELLRGLGFDSRETEFLIAYIVEDYILRELPERLWCTGQEVERLRSSVNRKIAKLRYESAVREQEAYEKPKFGTE